MNFAITIMEGITHAANQYVGLKPTVKFRRRYAAKEDCK
jgi:hypothetical protein